MNMETAATKMGIHVDKSEAGASHNKLVGIIIFL